MQVEEPSGRVLYEKRGISSGQFAFTTKEDGDFKACFTAKGTLNKSSCDLNAKALGGDIYYLTASFARTPLIPGIIGH